MYAITGVSPRAQGRALWISTIAFVVCFAIWTIFSIIGVQISKDLGLNDTQFGLLVGTPILSGAIIRLVLGIWTDQYGGRLVQTVVMLSAGISTLLLSLATNYVHMLAAALGVGIAGGSFAVGVAYISRWYPTEKQGTALGLLGLGNVGASITHFTAPYVMVAFGWPAVARVWAAVLMVMLSSTGSSPGKTRPPRRGGPEWRGLLPLPIVLRRSGNFRFGAFHTTTSSRLVLLSRCRSGCPATMWAFTACRSKPPGSW